MSWYYKGFTVRNKYGEILSANDEGHSSGEDNALQISTHFTVFETRAEAEDFVEEASFFRAVHEYDDLGPYVVEEVLLGWV